MKKILLFMTMCSASICYGQTAAYHGVCTQGATGAVVSGVSSSNQQISAFPGCMVHVYLTGTTMPATLYSNSSGTPLSNPFTAQSNALISFYASTANHYDITMSATGMTTTTISDVALEGGAGAVLAGDNTAAGGSTSKVGTFVSVIGGASAFNATASKPNSSVVQRQDLFTNSFTAYGGGLSLGNSGLWRQLGVENETLLVATRGISQTFLKTSGSNKHAVGDDAGIYLYNFGDQGVTAQSDEGHTQITSQGGENQNYFHGTVASIAAGSYTPALRFTSGNNWTTDGAFLLDITRGTVSGSLTGRSKTVPGTVLQDYPTNAKLPLTKAWGITKSNIPPTGQSADINVPITLTVTLQPIGSSTPAFTEGGTVCVAGVYYPEQVPITAVSKPSGTSQDITISRRNPNRAGSAIFQGGVCGQYVSFDDSLVYTKMRTSDYAYGSLTGSDLIGGTNLLGGQAHQYGLSGYGTGFHLFSGAEVVRNNSIGADPTLEPNSVNWAVGDVVENPHYPFGGGHAFWFTDHQYTPSNGNLRPDLMLLQAEGTGIDRGYLPFVLENTNPLSMYHNAGTASPIMLPNAMNLIGPFGEFIRIQSGPFADGDPIDEYPSVINVEHTAQGNGAPFTVFSMPGLNGEGSEGPGVPAQIYDPKGRAMSFINMASKNGTFSGAVNAGTVNVVTDGVAQLNLKTTGNDQGIAINLIAPGVNSTTLGCWGTGNGAGLPGVCGLIDEKNAHFIWNSNTSDDLFGNTPVTDVALGKGAAWSLKHTGDAAFGSSVTSPLYYGPSAAPSGSCSTKGAWVFSQDGHASFCAGGTWVTKI
jgi:hypothetical protein